MRQETMKIIDRIRFAEEIRTKPESHYTLRERLILRGWEEEIATDFVNNLYGSHKHTIV